MFSLYNFSLPAGLSRLLLVPTASLLLLLAGCATQPEAQAPGRVSLGEARQPQLYIHASEQDYPPVQGLDQNLTYRLLSAELAGQRNLLDFTLDTYIDLAIQTRKAEIAERATWIAQFAQQQQAALDAAIIWADAAPDNPDAQRTAAGLLLQNEDYLQAFEHLLRYEQLSGDSNFALLAGHLSETGHPLLQELYQLMLQESQNRAQPSADLQTALALISWELGRKQQTQSHLDQALELDPLRIRALQLQARLYRAENKMQAALELLQQALKEKPEEIRLWLEVARTQLENQQLQAAENTFDRILRLQPENPQIRLALARIQMETRQYPAAEATLQPLTRDEALADQAYLLLGEAAQRQGNRQRALDFYAAVDSGQALLEASRAGVNLLLEQHRGTGPALELLDRNRQKAPELITPLTLMGEQLLRQEEQLTAALEWVDGGRELLPRGKESTPLLYSRALLEYELGHLDQMEADLRQLLELEPNNAMALNALGYTLVKHTDDRINEGLLLIRKAHALNSEAPEILDSLGWALFRLDRLEEAREHLETAYERLPDEEIGVHLVEVLWEMGEHQQARQLLNELRQQDPTPLIDQLLQRKPQLEAR
ncbi:tetratricopeptide repeat protein [Marinospirillum perlucidum]|uniref:tetratricopeptide repeat protein n=1 Tax=Marinospirillum perlucidum TaxID=1982602 RepID=UPI00138FE308|nr:tetratricopeptide repeat protein [Marinospirillum perlucidum]